MYFLMFKDTLSLQATKFRIYMCGVEHGAEKLVMKGREIFVQIFLMSSR